MNIPRKSMDRLNKSILVYFGLLVLVTASAVSVIAQPDNLVLVDIPNGFKGTYKSADETWTIDASEAADRSLRTKIATSTGGVVAEVLYFENLVTVTLSGISISFRTNPARYVEPLSQANQEKFEAFRVSEESRLLRTMFKEIIKRREASKPSYLKGILIMSMVLGDGPGFASSTGRKKDSK